MRIAIPVDDDKKNICVSFGRTPYFLIFDEKTGQTEIKENPAADAEGGAGLKAAQFVVDNNADAVITKRCGINSAEVMHEADIKIYKSNGQNAEENIKDLMENRLDIMEDFHSGYHGIK